MASSDAELIARILLKDDRDAFGELVARHQSPLRAWLRRLTGDDWALADDLAQEAFLRAYRELRHFRADSKFATWLFAIAYNLFRREARRPQRLVGVEEHVLEAFATDADSGSVADMKFDLDAAMSILSLDQRAAITLCYQQGMTHQEAAAVLNTPLGTLKTNILRAKERLQALLRNDTKLQLCHPKMHT